MPWEIIIFSLLGIIVVTLIWGLLAANHFQKLIKHIEEAEKAIEQTLIKRCQFFQEIYQLSQKHLKHEKEFLQQVCDIEQLEKDASLDKKQAFSNHISKGFQILFRAVDDNPELKNNAKMSKLMNQTIENDEQIQASKRIYNTYVSQYNQKVVVFPSHIIAQLKKLTKRPFFEVEPLLNEESIT